MANKFTRKVLVVTQSPMNPRRWCLDLACGHEVWISQRAKPTLKATFCNRCAHAD